MSSNIRDEFEQALNYEITEEEREIYLYNDERDFVSAVIDWSVLKDLIAFPSTCVYILNELSQEFMASRILYFWE